MTVSLFVQGLITSLLLGSLYTLLAVGYTVVFGILGFINFAHISVFVVGAYLPISLAALLKLPWYACFLISIPLIAFLGILVDRVAYRPLRQAPKLSMLISGVGVSFFLENLILLLYGGVPQRFVTIPAVLSQTRRLGSIYISTIDVFGLGAAVIALFFLYYVVYKTKSGLAMRALAEDAEVSGLMGVRTDQTIGTAFAMGSALAAIGAITWCLRFPVVSTTIGMLPGTKAFIAAVIGGVGNIPGAIVGGLVLGVSEIMLVTVFPKLSAYRDVLAFTMLIVLLLWRPTGLLGAKMREQKM